MGGDGGALLNQRKLLSNNRMFSDGGADKKSDLAAAAAMNSKQRWHFCALTNKPLALPVVCDLRGDLFNKSAIVDLLLKRKELGKTQNQKGASRGEEESTCTVPHIAKLKDVRELQLPERDDGNDEDLSIVCPLTKVVADSGAQPFVVSWACGHVMSEACWKSGEPCPLCDDGDDVSAAAATFPVRLILDEDAAAKQLERLVGNIRAKRPRDEPAR